MSLFSIKRGNPFPRQEKEITDLRAKLQAAEAGIQRLNGTPEGGWYRAWETADQDRTQHRTRIEELEAACVIPDSGGHLESADCWCGPTVEEHPGGTLIIHNRTH